MNAAALYPWLKALHVVAAMTFVGGVLAGLLALQPLLSNGVSSLEESGAIRSLRTWHREVTTPAMLTVWVLGMVLALQGGWFTSFWLQAKLALVFVLSAIHGVQSGVLRRLAGGSALRMQGLKFSRWLTIVLAAGIAVLVIVKPF
jgi:protoporphyrinogen IX oxidase